MPQILQMPDGRKLDVDRAFMDGGAPAAYTMVGGQRVMVEPGRPPRPQILMRGEAFFYADGQAVNRVEDVDWLPAKARLNGRLVNFKAMAMKFVAKQPPPPAAEVEDEAESGAIASPSPSAVLDTAAMTESAEPEPRALARPPRRRHRSRQRQRSAPTRAMGGVVVSHSDNPADLRPQPKPGPRTVAFKPEEALGSEALSTTRA